MANRRSRMVKRRRMKRQTGVPIVGDAVDAAGDAVDTVVGGTGDVIGDAGNVAGDIGSGALEGTEDALGYIGGGTEDVLRDIGGLGRDTLAVLPGVRTTREQRIAERQMRQEAEQSEGSGDGGLLGGSGGMSPVLIAGAAVGVAGLVYFATQRRDSNGNGN